MPGYRRIRFVLLTSLKKRLDKFYPNYTLAKIRDLYYN
jgi:hypothetical protein